MGLGRGWVGAAPPPPPAPPPQRHSLVVQVPSPKVSAERAASPPACPGPCRRGHSRWPLEGERVWGGENWGSDRDMGTDREGGRECWREGQRKREERDRGRGRERPRKFSTARGRARLAPWEGPGTLRLWVGHKAGPRDHGPLRPCLAIGFYQHQGDSTSMPGSDAPLSRLKVNTSWLRRQRRGPELGPSGVPLPWPDGRPESFCLPFPIRLNS